ITEITYDLSEHYYSQGSMIPDLMPVGQIKCNNAPNSETGNPEVKCIIADLLPLALGVMKGRFPSFNYDDYTDEVLTLELRDMGAFQFNAIYHNEDEEYFDGFQLDARRANFIDFFESNTQ